MILKYIFGSCFKLTRIFQWFWCSVQLWGTDSIRCCKGIDPETSVHHLKRDERAKYCIKLFVWLTQTLMSLTNLWQQLGSFSKQQSKKIILSGTIGDGGCKEVIVFDGWHCMKVQLYSCIMKDQSSVSKLFYVVQISPCIVDIQPEKIWDINNGFLRTLLPCIRFITLVDL